MENKNNKKQIAIIVAGILLVMVLVVSITYAYFTAQATSNKQEITTGKVKLEYSDPQNNEPYVIAENIKPLVREDAIPRTEEGLLDQESAKAAIKTFTLTNTGTEKLFVDISLDELTLPTDLKRYDFMYALYEGGKNVSIGSFEYMENGTKIMEHLVFEAGQSKEYQLCIWIEEANLDQSVMMNETFSAKITATGTKYWETPAEYFTFDEASGAITGYTNVNEEGQAIVTDISIPSKINGATVTEIDVSAFAGDGLTSVIIPNSIEIINNNAFNNNKLTSLVIPNSVVRIGRLTFRNNQLKSVIIPDSVTSTGNDVFSNNQLTNIVIPNSITTIIAKMFGYNKLTSIIIPNSVTSIGNGAFVGNQISNLVLGNNVESIDHAAFEGNQITNIIIPNSVTSIGRAAFTGNQLPDSQAYIYKRNSDGTIDTTTLISYGGANKDVVIPSGVVTIDENAFASCSLTSVTIPDTVTTINKNAFSDNQLASVIIPANVTSICASAFVENPNLTTITLKGRTEIPSTWDSTWYDSTTTNVVFE